MSLYQSFRKSVWEYTMRNLPRGPWITRYSMYKQLRTIRPLLPNHSGRALTISRSANLLEIVGIRPTEVVEADFPDHDILNLKFDDASFDFVLSDQVLEHVEGSPQRAIDQCFRILKTGGVAIHTTCFVNPIHEWPKDFWRFTPEGLRLLHKEWSEVIECGGWGNFDAWTAINDGLRFEGVPHAAWHPLHKLAVKNDPLWPISTWIVARK